MFFNYFYCCREKLLYNVDNEENYNLLEDIYETLNYDCGKIIHFIFIFGFIIKINVEYITIFFFISFIEYEFFLSISQIFIDS